MKRILMSTAIVAAMTTGAYAQTAQTNTQPAATQSQQTGSMAADASASGNVFAKMTSAASVKGDLQASALIGKDVYIPKPATEETAKAGTAAPSASSSSAASAGGASGNDPMAKLEDVGSVGDVILSKDGKVDAVLVDVGGFLGIGSHTVALNWSALQWKMKDGGKTPADSYLVVQATKAQLEKAPAFKAAWLTKGAAAETDQAMSGDTAKPASAAVSAKADGGAAPATSATADQGQQKMAAGTMNNGQAGASADATAAAGAGPMAKAEAAGFTKMDPSAITKKDLAGAAIYDAKGDDVGKVSKVIIDPSSNKLEGAVVNIGGFLGIGEKTIELKASDMNVMAKSGGKDVRIYVPQTEKELKQMPAYKKG